MLNLIRVAGVDILFRLHGNLFIFLHDGESFCPGKCIGEPSIPSHWALSLPILSLFQCFRTLALFRLFRRGPSSLVVVRQIHIQQIPVAYFLKTSVAFIIYPTRGVRLSTTF